MVGAGNGMVVVFSFVLKAGTRNIKERLTTRIPQIARIEMAKIHFNVLLVLAVFVGVQLASSAKHEFKNGDKVKLSLFCWFTRPDSDVCEQSWALFQYPRNISLLLSPSLPPR